METQLRQYHIFMESSTTIVSLTTATNYFMREVGRAFRQDPAVRLMLFRDVIFVHMGTDSSQGSRGAFIFPYGVLVMWGLTEEERAKIIETVRPYEENSYDQYEKDIIQFRYGKKTEIVDDQVTLASSVLSIKLALSHALAQSVKLSFFESFIKKTIETTRLIPESLSRYGKIPLSRKEMRKKTGELFLERSFVNMHLDILDTPEYFWDHSELEHYYRQIANYLELSTRLEVMNKRLDIIHDLLEMMSNELNHQHSMQLEWTIIILIVLEVFLSLLWHIFPS